MAEKRKFYGLFKVNGLRVDKVNQKREIQLNLKQELSI